MVFSPSMKRFYFYSFHLLLYNKKSICNDKSAYNYFIYIYIYIYIFYIIFIFTNEIHTDNHLTRVAARSLKCRESLKTLLEK